MKPSDFRKLHPELSDRELAMAYALHEGTDPDGSRARDAFERWDEVLMGDRVPYFVAVDLGSDTPNRSRQFFQPIRIQLSRAKGWRMPASTVNVARGPGRRWGNPWVIGKNRCWLGAFGNYYEEPIKDAAMAVRLFREMLQIERRKYPSNEEIRAELRGKNLACWCKLDAPCHADVLLRIANEDI